MAPVYFWSAPIRYCRWAAREKPAYFWSVMIGLTGPLSMLVVPPIRRRLGDPDAPQIPLTYPGMLPPISLATGSTPATFPFVPWEVQRDG